MKRGSCLLVFLFAATLSAADFPVTADEITEEWLIDCGKWSGYTDHIPIFKIIFGAKK